MTGWGIALCDLRVCRFVLAFKGVGRQPTSLARCVLTLEHCAATRPGPDSRAIPPERLLKELAMSKVALSVYESRTIARALRVMEKSLVVRDVVFESPALVRQYLALRLFNLEAEVFMVLLLDAQNRLIEARELFRGTVSQTVVYPREVVKAALLANASAVIFAHNHPSGMPDPSQADKMLTDALRSALTTVDVRVLDHIIVAGPKTTSFAERGWL
jgi:DNA repair protein RadC